MKDLAILGCYAHPDDEQGITGTLKLCLDQGIRAGIVCATRGEVGQISDPALATPETLGMVRERELREAAAVIGISDVFFLDYRDSGMAGSPHNADPTNFINADPHEAVGRLVKVIRAFKPTILVTFDPTGGYGHPDHLAIYKWTTEAFHAAGDPAQYPDAGAPFAPSRLFYASIGRSMIKMFVGFLAENNLPSPFGGADMSQMGIPDEDITHIVEVRRYVGLKRESLSKHRTQMAENSSLAALPEELWNEFRAYERFQFVMGTPFPPHADPADLFAGLR
jgi:LmbE family N-acetylglucosaminyl deacetylase